MKMQQWGKEPVKKLFGKLVLLNFVSFFVGGIYLGGDALNGKIEDGRFYLANHGQLTEVSEGIYRYSQLHALSVLLLIGVVMIVHFGKKND
ncbi:hypothetical protein ACHAC9_08005 [Massilia sp. CMS3.1]|uniref:hypothetical protein n=1 Tax=Massilia sp. CMS3.1 TaxID=3373083 RepID=UPI003EE5DA4B